ncbi:hypothetical protein V7S43_013640 [Phytophthora oleae]|uniref:Uncharacterized protein n=1 Tax=Phytophthora oleae TaxID=2107226 RepID=A0ABD3F4N5_9STRA
MSPTNVSSSVRAKQWLAEFHSGVSSIEKMQEAANADMTKLLVFFRQEADRKADADATRRREDREDRETAEKRDRDLRERDRQVEQAALETRMLRMCEEDRGRREEEVRKDLALRQEREQERAEERRRHEERIELERSEVRQRHEQMVTLLSKFAGK